MNLKKYISALLLGGALMGGMALTPSMADAAPLSGIRIQPLSIELTATDDDGGGSTTSTRHFISQPAKTLGTNAVQWRFGGCSGPQTNGEVWVQATVVATLATPTTYNLHVHLDLYEDTSSTCGGRTVNFPLGDLDLDGSADVFPTGSAPGVINTFALPVFYDGHSTLDGGLLKIGFQASLV